MIFFYGQKAMCTAIMKVPLVPNSILRSVRVCGWVLGAVAPSSRPIDIQWSSEKVKTLGVVIGPGNLEHANCQVAPEILCRHVLFGFTP